MEEDRSFHHFSKTKQKQKKRVGFDFTVHTLHTLNSNKSVSKSFFYFIFHFFLFFTFPFSFGADTRTDRSGFSKRRHTCHPSTTLLLSLPSSRSPPRSIRTSSSNYRHHCWISLGSTHIQTSLCDLCRKVIVVIIARRIESKNTNRDESHLGDQIGR